jgi:hypothetical protein
MIVSDELDVDTHTHLPSPQCPNGVGPNLSEQAKLNSHDAVCYERGKQINLLLSTVLTVRA